MTAGHPPWERRVVAGLLGVTVALGLLLVLALATAGIGDLLNGGANTPDAPLYIAAAVLTVPAALAGGRTVQLAIRYARGAHGGGRSLALWALAAWVAWFAWGVPASGAWLSAALVIYTALALPVVGLVLLISWLARRERS